MFSIIKAATPRYNFNRIWNQVRRESWLRKNVQRELDLPLASDLLVAARPSVANIFKAYFAGWLLGPMALRGADGGYGGESRRWLQPDVPTVEDWTATGVEQTWNIHDRFIIDLIGGAFSVAGTATALVMNFDLWTGPFQTGTETTDLDGTNGVVTSPNATTAQAIGSIVYKDLSQIKINVEWGNSIEMDVATAVTSGNGISFIVGYPVAENIANATNNVNASS